MHLVFEMYTENGGCEANMLAWLLPHATDVLRKGSVEGSTGPLKARWESLSCSERKRKLRTKSKT